MDRKRWNQARLAKESGLTPAYISFLMTGIDPKSGKPPNPSRKTLKKLGKAIMVDPDKLEAILEGTGYEPVNIEYDETSRALIRVINKLLEDMYPDPVERSLKFMEYLRGIEQDTGESFEFLTINNS